MLNLNLPSPLDAQLFKTVTTTDDIPEIVRLIEAGARLDWPFSLDYKIGGGTVTHFTLTSLEALCVGWDLPALAEVLSHLGPLPNVVLPNVLSALHQVYVERDGVYRLHNSYTFQEKKLLQSFLAMDTNASFWYTTSHAPTLWECIAHKKLYAEHLNQLPYIINGLKNIAKIAEEHSLSPLVHLARTKGINDGLLLCVKIGIDESLHGTEGYQFLCAKSMDHNLAPYSSSVILSAEVDQENVCRSLQRKM